MTYEEKDFLPQAFVDESEVPEEGAEGGLEEESLEEEGEEEEIE